MPTPLSVSMIYLYGLIIKFFGFMLFPIYLVPNLPDGSPANAVRADKAGVDGRNDLCMHSLAVFL